MKSDLNAIIERYAVAHSAEAATNASLEELLSTANCTSRFSFPGHITASAILINPVDGRTLLIRSPKFGRLLFPGGHCEPRELPHDTALRELDEECGLRSVEFFGDQVSPIPLHVDIHKVPARPQKDEPEHWHFDFAYRFRWTGRLSEHVRPDSNEVEDVVWLTVPALGVHFPEVARKLSHELNKGVRL